MANEHAIQATGTFVVSKGFRLLTKLAASQGSLQFTRAAVGTGKPPEGYSPESMIGLNAYKIDAEIADYGVQDDMAYITVQVSSDNVTEGFLVTEVGVFAEDPDEGEILYGYMDISTDPTYIYANGSTNRSKFAEFTLYVLVGSVSNVIAAVTPGSIITRDTFTAANLKAIDTHGILGGEAGAETTGQGLIDALTNKLLTEFVTNTVLMERLGTYVLKSKIVNDFLSTDEETVLSGPMGKLLKEQLNVLNTNKSDKGTLGNVVVNDVRTINLGNTGETVQTFTIPAPGTYIVFGSLCSFGTGSKSGLLGFEFNGSAGMDVYNQCGSYEDSTNSFRGLQHSSPVVVHTANASIRYRIYNTSTGSYTLRFIALRIK